VVLERPIELQYVTADRTLDRRVECHLFFTIRPFEAKRYSMHMPARDPSARTIRLERAIDWRSRVVPDGSRRVLLPTNLRTALELV